MTAERPARSRLRRSARTLFQALLLFVVIAVLLFFALPPVASHWLVPQLFEKLAVDGSVEIDHFSLSRLTASGRVTTDKITAEFAGLSLSSPLSLLSGREAGINVQWCRLTLRTRGGNPAAASSTTAPGEKRAVDNSEPMQIVLPVAITAITVANGELVVDTTTTSEEEELHLLFSSTLKPQWQRRSDGNLLTGVSGVLRGSGALPLTLAVDAAFDRPGTGHVELSGEIAAVEKLLQLPLAAIPTGVDISGGQARFAATADIDKTGQLTWRTQLQLHQTAVNLPGGVTLASPQKQPVQLIFTGNNNEIHSSVETLLVKSPLQLEVAAESSFNLHSQQLTLTATAAGDLTRKPLALTLTVGPDRRATAFDLGLRAEKITAKGVDIPQLDLFFSGRYSPQGTTARAVVDVPELRLPQVQTELSGLHLNQPIQYPPPRRYSRSQGKLRINRIRWNTTTVGSVNTTLTQTHTGLKSRTRVESPLADDLRLNCDSNLDLSPFAAEGSCRLPETRVDLATVQKQLGTALLPELTAGGTVSGRLDWRSGKGSLSLSVAEGELSHHNVRLEGIETTLTLPDLASLRSAPSQQLAVKKIEAGDIRLQNARIRWQLESPHSLFVEQIHAGWCGGTIESAAMRLTPEPNLQTTIYCDRLNLGELLTQLGVRGASGKVSLSGRLPVSFLDNHLQVNSGFLYSSPGEKMTLRFADTTAITKSLGTGAAAPNLAYSLDALKNFACNWTTLTLTSRGDDLLMQMQLDGAPAEPLPYSRRQGVLVPKKNGSGIIHPLHFDINFHLPLQQLFEAGTGWQSMMNKFKETQ